MFPFKRLCTKAPLGAKITHEIDYSVKMSVPKGYLSVFIQCTWSSRHMKPTIASTCWKGIFLYSVSALGRRLGTFRNWLNRWAILLLIFAHSLDCLLAWCQIARQRAPPPAGLACQQLILMQMRYVSYKWVSSFMIILGLPIGNWLPMVYRDELDIKWIEGMWWIDR